MKKFKWTTLLTVVFSGIYLLFSVQAVAAAIDETQWYALFLAGKKSGYSKVERSVKDQLVTTTVTSVMQIQRADSLVQIKSIEQSVETLTGEALLFSAIEQEGDRQRYTRGVINGDKLNLVVESDGATQYRELPWDTSSLLFEGQRLLGMKGGLSAGTEYQANTFIISTLQPTTVTVKVAETLAIDLLGKVVELTKTDTSLTVAGAKMSITAYVDQWQNYKKMSMAIMGTQLELIATSEQYALSANQPSNFFTQLLIKSPQKITPQQSSSTLSYAIARRSEQAQFLESDEQKVSILSNGDVSIEVTPIRKFNGRFPYTGAAREITQYLEPNSWVQSTHPQIIKLAKHAVGGTTSASLAAQKIEAFVRSYIVIKDLSVGYASALQVLKSQQGDCTEHALLLVAMLKAVGIPARVASGVVYVDRFIDQQQTFVPHAWAQAYIDGQWVSYDAALAGFDSTHILFANGDGNPTDFFNLINTLGNFEIKSIEVIN